MEKFVKAPAQIAARLEHWFHKFVAVGKEPDNFVLFPALPAAVQEQLYAAMALPAREIPIWTIPTGRAGFKFWHVTNKCDMIWCKYIIQED
ncbi:hypothetical protein MKQ70_24255 [Chitinophaga sedimenti]|uniref:hypothetical protein n=1 Tax=Chitinophaga sedimenti TaxID=2033606 RepID=UPI00200519BF|nr:hypothetical protein [Chitinophaga sedimenti]MCK7557952.1 hypothetical protein [Chitinophaga sedimenti]